VVAKAGKRASKKRKAKKVRTSPPLRAGKKAAAKKKAAKTSATKGKRVAKKAGKASKKATGKVAKKAPKKPAKKVAKKAAKPFANKPSVPKTSANKVPAEKPAKKAVAKKRAVAPQAKPEVLATPAVEVEAAAPTPAPAAAPIVAAERNTYFITTAIAYPNGLPHIGHAYEAIATDALARFQRLNGKDVFFLTGTDEHGLKMVQTAESEGLGVAELAQRNAGRFREMDERLNVSFDRFIRTTEPDHHRSVQVVWDRMQQNGDIYIDTYSGWYSVRDEAYYAEEETSLGEDDVRRGPQGTPVEWVEEKSYFFRLSAYQDRLLKLYDSQPDFIGPDSRRNEVISFVKSGLKDLSISRTTFDWGVKVPHDPEHVMYVWVDALTNYITGVGFPDESNPNWRYWPADVHIIGKDIIRFHAVYWPAFLMSAGIPVQKRVYAHGFLFNRGEKMSKSVGNVVDPFNLGRPVRRRPDALFLPARGTVRAGRQLQP
jgi:methionyl-tRNA synthetase